MSAADPYREWLNIQQPRRPLTHYELLRLRSLESDPRVIRAAADLQVQRLSRVDNTAARKAVSQLLREVAAARDCLLDARQKAAYDTALRTAGARLGKKQPARAADAARVAKPLAEDQPAAALLPPRLSAAAVAADRVAKEKEEEVASQTAAITGPESVAVATGISTHRRRVIAARKKGRSNWVWQAGAVTLLATAAAIGVIWWVTDGHQRVLGISSRSDDHGTRPPVVETASPPRDRPAADHDTESMTQTNDDVRHSAPPDPVVDVHDATTHNPVPALTTDSDAPPHPEEVAAVGEALKAFQRALAQRDLPAAAAALDKAADGAQHPQLAERVSQSRTLLHYVRGFWNAVEQSIATLKGGEELMWRRRRSIVVEADAGRFILRVAGVNHIFQSEQLPADLAVLLAQRWLAADDPNSPVFTAAFLSVDPDGDRRRARSIYRSARAQGIEAADDLLAVLGTMPTK